MKCLRIFADGRGESHFDEVDIPLSEVNFAPPAPPLQMSERLEARNLIFATLPRDGTATGIPRRRASTSSCSPAL